jgi:glycosyltransferase involved in cell wall biosynthesis
MPSLRRGSLRILIVSNLYPDARLPAFGTFVAAHAEALQRAGAIVEVIAITGTPAHQDVIRKYAALSVRTLFHALTHRFRGMRPQVVEAHVAYPTALIAWIAARVLGARLVVYSHGSDVTSARSDLHRRLARRVFRAADLHVANSRFIAETLAERFRVEPGRILVLSPGIDFKRFALPRSYGKRSGVLYVGRLSSGKGVHELLAAVARLEEGKEIRFVGDGPDRATLEQEAATMGIPATFDGAVAPEAVAVAMRAAAVVAVPSTYPEGLGLVALEAMAAGALVVASDIGGLPESVINDRTGWLVPAGDVDALASALSDALALSAADDSGRRSQLLRRALAKARSHDVDAIARRLLVAYDALGGR